MMDLNESCQLPPEKQEQAETAASIRRGFEQAERGPAV